MTASILRSVDELSQLVRRASFVIKASINDSPAGMVRMRQPVSRALEALEGKILGQGAVITSPSDWPEVTGVSTWLETIWWNLVANAVEHAGTAPRIELGWDEQAGEIRFWVSDNGPGVPAARRNKLFHKFETLHEMDSSRGMGLSIVQRLVDLQGGHCGYEPNPGGGARFFFVLPV